MSQGATDQSFLASPLLKHTPAILLARQACQLLSPNPKKKKKDSSCRCTYTPPCPSSPIIISPWHTHTRTPELPSYLQLKVLQFWQPSAEIEANLIYFTPFSIFVPSPPLRLPPQHTPFHDFSSPYCLLGSSRFPHSSHRREAIRLLWLLSLDLKFSECQSLQNWVQM